MARGRLQPDLWGVEPSDAERRAGLRSADVGLRNSLLIAIAPTATIASIAGCYERTEPQVSNLFKRETLSGEFLQINTHLVRDLQRLGVGTTPPSASWWPTTGRCRASTVCPRRCASSTPPLGAADAGADRHGRQSAASIDQSPSLNLFVEQPSIGKVSSMNLHAWRQGLKTTYYLRSRPASRIATSTAHDRAAVACSLENPETCEACD